MSVYIDNLYGNIISENFKSDKLKTITGYASAPFLKKVIEEIPDLIIEIYIGMSQQGISINNHKEFCNLMNKHENLKIYYQIKGKNNHMKLYEFSKKSTRKTIIGSANFTENGFFNNQEIMVEAEFDTNDIFKRQKELSLLCTTPNIDKFIDFYNEDSNDVNVEGETQRDNNSSLSNISTIQKEQEYISTFKKLKTNPNPHYYRKFKIEIVLNKHQNPTWSEKGINAWINNRQPYLQSSQKVFFEKYFPNDEIFYIYTDDGIKFKCKLGGKFNSEIHFVNSNIYEYVKRRINLTVNRPISRDDLINYGNTAFNFTRVNETKYLLEFKN
ncbi:restriction endonuclease PLD domain-containing protein [Mammaliicoccus fleurettii]|uniref:restriction endonuclease PLD domain-containing protein n=1 Tax=Mammaliicoccus fleurettii TaxID=150056 RepID=UPI002DBE123D|nr:restriction endonuclease PLD domain-containing protein [Mammaliicoccus fleurettii]MEB8068153.1 NgoFVII family restriction endonuclease [Mammaliicoccus fleurettii]